MPPARSTATTGFYHVVNRGADQTPLFEQPEDYRAFLAILQQGLARYQSPLISYCILENHWHLLIGPVGKSRLWRTICWVTTTHERSWRSRRGVRGDLPVYESRFTSTPIQDLATLVPMSRYVERNAKSAGLVEQAEDWPWSSLRQRVTGQRLIAITPAAFLASRSWLDYVNAAITRHERQVQQASHFVRAPHARSRPTGFVIDR